MRDVSGTRSVHLGEAAGINGMSALEPSRLRLLMITGPLRSPGPRDSASSTVEVRVLKALVGGVTSVQLRDKETATGTLLPLAHRIRALCHDHGALFFVNDRVDLALASGADGVHLGDDDLPVHVVREIAPELWVGASADTAETAQAAIRAGAHYVGCGTIWATDSKADAGTPIGIAGLTAVAQAITAPVVAIGGITIARAPELVGSGAAGIAVIRGLWDAPDITTAARAFRQILS